jgi:hypothetical protein
VYILTEVGGHKRTGLWYVSSPAQDAALVAEAERNPFFRTRDLKTATGFPGQKATIILRLRAAGLRAQHAAVHELLTDEHKLYRLAFSESNVDRMWDRVIFTDESTSASANDGPVLVYRPHGQRYNRQYMSTHKCSGRVSVHCCGWNFPLYRGPPGWPAVSAHFAEQNSALSTDALSQWYNPFTARPLLHS